jgi:hypothetical protein
MTDDGNSGDDVDVLKANLSVAVREPGFPAEKLRELVCALVDKMKAMGAPPEKVVVAVKQAVLNENEVVALGAKRTLQEIGIRQEILQQALSWCIQRYYGASG